MIILNGMIELKFLRIKVYKLYMLRRYYEISVCRTFWAKVMYEEEKAT